MIEFTGTLGLTVGLLIVVVLFHYVNKGKIDLGVRLLLAGAAFLLVALGIGFIGTVLDTSGNTILGGQVQNASVYIGYTLSAICCIVGALIIALKNLLARK